VARRKNKVSKKEKLLYLCGFLCLVGMVALKVFFGASIGNYKMNIEKIRYEIVDEEKDVESLTMQVNELTSFDNVQNVVKDLGLAYNNDNIIILND